jgi:hypothetical protein
VHLLLLCISTVQQQSRQHRASLFFEFLSFHFFFTLKNSHVGYKYSAYTALAK